MMNKNILFDKYFFDHLRDYSKISNFTHKFVVFLLEKRCIVKIIIIFESFLGIVLNLRVPVYSSVIKFTAENLEGLPRFYGCYFRSLYYSKKLKALNSNVPEIKTDSLSLDVFNTSCYPKEEVLNSLSQKYGNLNFYNENRDIYLSQNLRNLFCLGNVVDFSIEDNNAVIYTATNPKVSTASSITWFGFFVFL